MHVCNDHARRVDLGMKKQARKEENPWSVGWNMRRVQQTCKESGSGGQRIRNISEECSTSTRRFS